MFLTMYVYLFNEKRGSSLAEIAFGEWRADQEAAEQISLDSRHK
jgi:hypothetical protein